MRRRRETTANKVKEKAHASGPALPILGVVLQTLTQVHKDECAQGSPRVAAKNHKRQNHKNEHTHTHTHLRQMTSEPSQTEKPQEIQDTSHF